MWWFMMLLRGDTFGFLAQLSSRQSLWSGEPSESNLNPVKYYNQTLIMLFIANYR